MKTIIAIAAVLLFATVSFSSPFIVADPSEATKYRMRLSGDDGATWSAWQEGPFVAGAMKFDVSNVPAGDYKCEFQSSITVAGTDPVSGQASSATLWVEPAAPFLLKVPTGQKIINIRVIAE